MEIYIEYVIVDNLVINYLILFFTGKILKRKKKKLRLILSSLFGMICALFFPLLFLNGIALIFLKLILGMIMILIAFPTKKIRRFITCFLTFLTVTGVFGGISFMLLFLLNNSFDSMILSSYNLPIPMGFIYLVLSGYFMLFNSLINFFERKKKIDQFIFLTKFFTEEKEIETNAFLDTGNTLCDPETNRPIIIITYNLFRQIYNIPIENLLMRKFDKSLENFKYINYSTITNEKKEILIFEIPKLEIQMKNEKIVKEKIFLGLSFSKCFSGCNALLNPQIF